LILEAWRSRLVAGPGEAGRSPRFPFEEGLHVKACILGTALSAIGIAALLVLGLGSCGGGGGGEGEGPPDAPHLLSGEYMYAQMTGPGAGPELRSELGIAIADGEGILTFDEGYATVEGTLTGPFTPPSRSYRVRADRTLTVVDVASQALEGRVTADGSLAAVTMESEPPLSPPAFLLLARRMAAPTQADLTGSWFLMQYGRATGPDAQGTGMVATVDVDGAGGIGYSGAIVNTDGFIPGYQIAFLPTKITPAPGGWLEWTNAAATQVFHLGGMSDDGNVMFFIARQDYESRAVIRVLVREGLASSSADLAGDYGVSALAGGSGFWITAPGTITLNGSGGGTLSHHGDDAAAVTYGVGPTGEASLNAASLYTVQGAVGPEGRSTFLGGSTTDHLPPMLYVLIR
jgi:hypothetical protein